MRISDWSSDVCSSDLGSHLAFFGLALRPRPLENLRSRGAGNGQHAVHIAENQVARLDHHAGEADREADFARAVLVGSAVRSEEHTSELQSLMRISYAVFCLKKQK